MDIFICIIFMFGFCVSYVFYYDIFVEIYNFM